MRALGLFLGRLRRAASAVDPDLAVSIDQEDGSALLDESGDELIQE